MKRVVFASGKGGTGKTTLTAMVAGHLSAVMPIVLADCDVEAANLPIALGAADVVCGPFAGSPKTIVDAEKCRGCGACVAACRFDALGPGETFGRDRAYAVDRWACEGCGACVPVCPFGALSLVPSQAGEVCRSSTTVGPMAFGRLAPGEDLSGKLVTEVRTRAEEAAAASGAAALLIDGPPGVGCPATAAIANTDVLVAVTEPTVSGAHDLARLIALAHRLRVPVAVVLNKADLSASGAARIRALVREEGLELIAEVPYDAGAARLFDGDRLDRSHLSEDTRQALVLVSDWVASRLA